MRILCIHPSSAYNPGDIMTLYGSQYLMRKAFKDVEFLQFDIRRAEREIETYVPEYNWGEDIDVILLAGSPWVSGQADDIKYKMLRQARKRWPGAKTLALGIGSVFRYKDVKTGDYGSDNGEDTRKAVEVFRDFDFIMTRDEIASTILSGYKIRNRLFFDTSIFAYFSFSQIAPSRKGHLLVYYDPFVNDVWDHLPEEVWLEWVRFQIEWARERKAQVIAISSGDKGSAEKLGLECRFVTDLQWLSEAMQKATSVLSGRVHQAILARIMGCRDVACLPVDSRYLTAVQLGVQILQPEIAVQFRNSDDGRLRNTIGSEEKYLFPVPVARKLIFNIHYLGNGRYEKQVIQNIRKVCAR